MHLGFVTRVSFCLRLSFYLLGEIMIEKMFRFGVLALVAGALSGCGKFTARSPNSTSSSFQESPGFLVPIRFETTATPAVAQAQVSIRGQCMPGVPVELKVTDAPDRTLECSRDGRFAATVDLPGADGLKTLIASSSDKVGRVWSHSLTVEKDTRPPEVTVVSAVCQGNQPMVSGICENKAALAIQGDLVNPPAISCDGGLFQAAVQWRAGDGVKTVEVTQTDAAGNIGRASRTCAVSTTPPPPEPTPAVTIASPVNGSQFNGSPTLIGACTVGLAVQIGGTGVTPPVTATCTAGMYTQPIQLSVGDGAKEVRVSQTNANQVTSAATVTIIKDTVQPNLSLTSPAVGTIAAAGLTLKGGCETGLPVLVSGTGVASTVQGGCANQTYSIDVVFSTGDGAKTVSVSQTDGAGNKATQTRAFTKGDPLVFGTTLYANNCAGCHGQVGVSTKLGRTAAQIGNAIATIPAMGGLQNLSAGEIDAIALALSGFQPVAPPVTAADQVFAANNPSLYAQGRAYFPANETIKIPRRFYRLSRKQIDLTVSTYLSPYMMESIGEYLPKDLTTREGYETSDALLQFNTVNFAAYRVATTGLLTRVGANSVSVIDCSAQGNSLSCLQQKAREFVNRAFRFSAATADVDPYVTFFTNIYNQTNNVNTATAALTEAVLGAPQFLFRAELPPAGMAAIPPADLLQAVSYTVTDAPPARFGYNSAAAVSNVATDAATQNLVKALLATPEAKEKLIRFVQAWLQIKEADALTKDPKVFPEFTPQVAQAVLDETQRFLNAILGQAAPQLAQIVSSNDYYVSSLTAPLYGVTAAAANGSLPVKVNATERRGIFSQASVLASLAQANETAIIKRGKMIYNNALCGNIPPPPPDIEPSLDGAMGITQREKFESATKNQPCLSCHTYLNPFGFALENYSGIGKWRATDNGAAIDPVVTVDFVDKKVMTLRNPVEAIQFFTESNQFKACFVRQLFRFYMGRDETPSDDPVLRQLFMSLVNPQPAVGGQDIKSLLGMLVTSNRFKERQ